MSKKTKSNKSQIFKAPVEVGRDTIKIEFPKSVVDYININGDEIYWAPVNGVIQICGTQPHMVIPMLTIDDKTFLPQEENQFRAVAQE